MALKPVLRDVQSRATRLLAETRPGRETDSSPSPPPPPASGEEILEERQQVVLDAAEAAATLDLLRERLAADPASRLTISWRLTRPKSGGGG